MQQHTFNLDHLDHDTVPSAPLGAFDDADWHDVPEGYYLLPVHDWTKFSSECCGDDADDETPALDLLGFRVFVCATPTLIKTGKRAGQTIGKDRFYIGQLVLARGVQERVFQRRTSDDDPTPVTVRYTPSERLKREVDGDRFSAEHVFLGRDDREGYRRFFLEHGVDVLTARTLGTKEAEAMIARIDADLAAHGVQYE